MNGASDFMDIAFTSESSDSKIQYVVVGTNSVLVSKGKDGKFTHEKGITDEDTGIGARSPINCIAYSEKHKCFVAIAKFNRSASSETNKNYIITDLNTPGTWQVIKDSEISNVRYAWRRIA